jgi:hypothetical protein
MLLCPKCNGNRCNHCNETGYDPEWEMAQLGVSETLINFMIVTFGREYVQEITEEEMEVYKIMFFGGMLIHHKMSQNQRIQFLADLEKYVNIKNSQS